MAKHISPATRIQNLNYSKAYSFLDERERNYAYYLSKASWEGAKMVPHQVSYESPVLMAIFLKFF
jgi:hypothetical protein